MPIELTTLMLHENREPHNRKLVRNSVVKQSDLHKRCCITRISQSLLSARNLSAQIIKRALVKLASKQN